MPEGIRGIVERVGGTGTVGAAVVRIVGSPSGGPPDGALLAAILAAGRAAAEASQNGGVPERQSKSWKQAGRLEAMGTDSERRNGLR